MRLTYGTRLSRELQGVPDSVCALQPAALHWRLNASRFLPPIYGGKGGGDGALGDEVL